MVVTTRLNVTPHCAVRARQRGYRLDDFATAEILGTLVEDGILLRTRDINSELKRLTAELRRARRRTVGTGLSEVEGSENELIRQINRLQRLKGVFLPSENGRVLSVYRPCRRRLRSILGHRRR